MRIMANRKVSSRFLTIALAVLLAVMLFSPSLFRVLRADSSLPQVQLNADSIGPRPIEELTGHNVVRDYAYAWRDLAGALESNRAGLLNDYFAGFAKDDFARRIADQKAAGLTTRYIDHGHRVKAVFYSPDGGEMQLLDDAKLEIDILDGGKVIHQENADQHYLVLMTPGADRWFVRSLTAVPNF